MAGMIAKARGFAPHTRGLALLILVIFAVMSFLVPDKFLRPYNFISLSFVAPELGLLSLAMMVTMMSGGIDLSVIGAANLAAILAGLFFHAVGGAHGPALSGLSLPLVAGGFAIALAVGILAGVLNGILIGWARITPILATIGSGQIFTGLALVLTGGPAIVGFPEYWNFIGNGTLAGLAVPLWIFLAASLAIAIVLARSEFGISLALIGTNLKAAVYAGLFVRRTIFLSYVGSGVLAAIAGIILSGRTNAAKSDYGISYLLQAVLIAVLGGTDPAGGRASVLGIVLALAALMLLASGMQLLRLSNFLVDATWGAFLLASIALNLWRSRR